MLPSSANLSSLQSCLRSFLWWKLFRFGVLSLKKKMLVKVGVATRHHLHLNAFDVFSHAAYTGQI